MTQCVLESVANGFKGKHFETAVYDKNNNKAYEAAREHFKQFYIVLRPEDYNIDCDGYLSEEDYINKKPPLFKLELEIRTHFDREIEYNEFNFFGRKRKLLTQEVTPFWLVYNPACNNCMLVPFPIIMRGRNVVEKLNLYESDAKYDEFVKIPKVFGSIGVDKLDDAVINYFLSIANEQYKAIFGVDNLVEKDSLTPDKIRQIANIANASYRSIFGIKPVLEQKIEEL